jgi:integrase
MKLADFVEHMFVPELVALKNLSGRIHYQAILKHVLTPGAVDRAFQIDAATSRTRLKAVPDWPYLDELRLCDVRPEDVQKLIAAASEHGYSSQTVKHIRSVVRAIFELARKKRWFTGDNPASEVRLPEMIRKEAHALTLAQAEEVLGVMRYPEREVALIMILTGMNVAEVCGLQWKCVNLTDTWSNADGASIPPRSIAVRQQWHLGQLDKLGQQSRNRILPIPAQLSTILAGLSQRASYFGPDDFVLVTPAGTPVSAKQIAAHRLKAIGRKVQMPWLSWHVFGRTHTALAYQFGMQFLERVELIRRSEHCRTLALESPDAAAFDHPAASRADDLGLRIDRLCAASR